jgi:hypothetical protein
VVRSQGRRLIDERSLRKRFDRAKGLAAIASRPFYAAIPMRVRAPEPRLVPAERWPVLSADETSLVLLSPEHFYAIDAAGREYHEFTRVTATARGRVTRVENVRRLASPASGGAEASALEIRIVETPGQAPRVETSAGKVSFDLTAPEGAMTPWAFGLGGAFAARVESDLVESILNGASIRRIAIEPPATATEPTATESHSGHAAHGASGAETKEQSDAGATDKESDPAADPSLWALMIEPQASPFETRAAGRPADLVLFRRDVATDGQVRFTLLGGGWHSDPSFAETEPTDLLVASGSRRNQSDRELTSLRRAAIRRSNSPNATPDAELILHFTTTNSGDSNNLFHLLDPASSSLTASQSESEVAYGSLNEGCCCCDCYGEEEQRIRWEVGTPITGGRILPNNMPALGFAHK